MTNLLNYLGLINIVLFTTVIFILIRKTGFNIKKHTISYLGNNKKVGRIFNFTLFAFAVLQVIFSIHVTKMLINNGELILLLFILGGTSLACASIFTVKSRFFLHSIFVALTALLVGTAVIIISINIIPANHLLGLATIAASFLVFASFILSLKLHGAYWEFILFLGIFIWNIAFSIPLLFH